MEDIKLVACTGRKSELVEFLRWDAAAAKAQEPGTLRFDVWEASDEPDVVYLYEAYVDQAAFEAHKATSRSRDSSLRLFRTSSNNRCSSCRSRKAPRRTLMAD